MSKKTTFRATPEEMQSEVLKACKGKYLTVADLADRLGKSVNTVRAHYVYPLVRDGRLEPKYSRRVSGQAYKARDS